MAFMSMEVLVFFQGKPFGLAYTSSSDPKLTGGYYTEAVQCLGGCPRVVRGDLGTENGNVRGFQHFLLPTHPDGTLDGYSEGASTANQRY